MFVVCVSVSLVCVVCAVLGLSCRVCFWCVCFVCGVLCCCVLFRWFVVRACFVVVFAFVCVFCYGLNAFPVCDCLLYDRSLRCSPLVCVMLFVCLGVCVMACIWLFVYRIHWFVLCAVVLCYCFCCSRLLCMFCLWCVVLLVVVSLVRRACMICCCCVVFGMFCHGLNASPVYDCIWYVH